MDMLALALDDGKQGAARLEQRAAQIHLPKSAIDIACETLPKVGVGIRLVTPPHLLQHGVKLLLDRKLGGFQVFKPAIEIGAVDIE